MSDKTVAVLGATGSVGTQALDVARKKGYTVDAISCRRDVRKAEDAVREFNIGLCAVEDGEAASLLKAALKDTACKIIAGEGAAAKAAEESKADTVINAVTGVAGLMRPSKRFQAERSLRLQIRRAL